VSSRYFLWQHFFGLRIRTKDKQFNSEEFVLMDYSQTHEKRTSFFYVLPFADNEALVEFTEFSNHQYTRKEYEALVQDYIRNTLGIDSYEIVEEELNAIPMTDFQVKTIASKNVINIGSLAGYVKPSSGYAFTRTVERNQILARQIHEGNPLSEKTLNSTKTYKAFDNAVLYLIATEKVHGGLIFSNLFKKLNAGFIYRFLDEKIGAFGLFQVMLSAPRKIEFIKFFIKFRGK
jgi:lycopene beta-cyclase